MQPSFFALARAAVLCAVLLSLASCNAQRTPVAVSPQDLVALFEALQPGNDTQHAQPALPDGRNASRTDPNWPVLTYLLGEVHLKRNEMEQARARFRDVALWAASERSGRYSDGWGGSGLAAVALWRWLRIIDAQGGAGDEVDQALKAAARLRGTRLASGMARSSLLPALPLVEEDSARRVAHLAWKTARPDARALFLDFMSIDSTGALDAADEQIRQTILDEGLVTADRLDLFRFRRQLSLVNVAPLKQRAAERLRQLWQDPNAPADVRAEAAYEWSNFYRLNRERKNEVIAGLTSAYRLAGEAGPIAEKALYLRGMVHNSVKPKRPAPFFADMTALLERFPKSRLADDALYQLASEHLFGARPDYDLAFSYYERLRAFDGPNDWLDSGYVLAAIGLAERGTNADLQAADRLLERYVEHFPDGVFRLRALFWRGRIAERSGNGDGARRVYEQLATETPYDYYGLRASMHLDDGASAALTALPRPGSPTWNRVREAYGQRAADPQIHNATPYHERLRTAESSGLYARALAIVGEVGRRFRNRLDHIPLHELDAHGLVPAAALLLALRQDALAARDAALTADNHLRLAAFLGVKVGDWPMAMAMTHVRSDAPRSRIAELQQDPRYLATVYPGTEVLSVVEKPLAAAAWPIEGSTTLSQNVMYAVMRRESNYYSAAISSSGAIGLFQVMPATFSARPECWTPRAESTPPTPTSYLFDPLRNVQFWSCWARTDLKPISRDTVAHMLAKHQAGPDNFREWRTHWSGRAIEHDLEMQVEAFRFPATQVFARSVLADIAIVEASGLFESGPGANGRDNP